MEHTIKLVRVYDHSKDIKGYRILVDRLWPRGIRKENLMLDCWAREIAPSQELRKWFAHQKDRFDEFARRYKEELDHNCEAMPFVRGLVSVLEEQDVLLLYAAKSPTCNQAVVLRDWVQEQMKRN